MPAAAWAARSGDPVLFTDAESCRQRPPPSLKRHSEVPVYVLGPASAISSAVVNEIAKIGDSVHRVSGADPVANAIAFARYADGSFGWNINDPGHGFVLARNDSPLDAAPRRRSRPPAPGAAAAHRQRRYAARRAARVPLDVKPGYTTDPTRAFYNHVWVIGDQEAIDVNQQAEVTSWPSWPRSAAKDERGREPRAAGPGTR